MEGSKGQRVLAAWQAFLEMPVDRFLQRNVGLDAKAGVLQLFHNVVKKVPAYQEFLKEHQINPSSIQSIEAFQTLPLTTKQNYLRRYPLAQLCREGVIESCDLIAVSSGSTGTPTFWPRFITDEFSIAFRFEQIFRDSFQADKKRTLAVICFALGTWVGGIYTANCCRHLAAKGYPITVITPGNNKTEIFRVIQELGTAFEQVVLLGYPPFLKDVIDTGLSQGIEWGKYGIKLVMAGEVFSEEWRSLVGERMGSKNPCYDSASLYGTADAGVLGNETPLSICIRRFFAQNPTIARSLFGESRLPTLVQYDPHSRFFEVEDGTLLFSGNNGVPLIRYHISDQGGLISYEEMLRFLKDWNFDPVAELEKHSDRGIYALPFAFIFGRSHFTVSYFGANIYPENVTVGLEQSPIQDWVTGKFVLQVQEDRDHNRFLAVVVELAPSVEASEEKEKAISESILVHLRRLNSEFFNYVPVEYQTPKITLKSIGDPEYFPVGVKHRYTRQSVLDQE